MWHRARSSVFNATSNTFRPAVRSYGRRLRRRRQASAPVPASTQPMPSTSRPVSWNPAVPPPPVTGALVGYAVVVAGEGDGDGLALAEALDVVAVGETDAVALLLGARAVPLNRPVADGDRDVPPAVGFAEPVQAVIPRDNTIIAMTLTARMPTQCLFPGSARGNLDNR
jgi:hypothetical protein